MTTRRTLLAAGAATTVAAAIGGVAAAPAAAASAADPAPLLGDDPIAHLLRRATFGPTPESIAEATKLGVAGWLDRQLNPATIDDAACDRVLARLPLAGADIAGVRAK